MRNCLKRGKKKQKVKDVILPKWNASIHLLLIMCVCSGQQAPRAWFQKLRCFLSQLGGHDALKCWHQFDNSYQAPLPISLIRCFTLNFFILVGISSSWVRQNTFTEKAVLQYTHLTHIKSKERNRYRRRVKVSDTCFPYSFPIAYRYYFQETHSLLVISYLVEWKESDWKQYKRKD
jgi:hypothetical protein